MKINKITSKNIAITFGKNPTVIEKIQNIPLDISVCAKAIQSLLIRFPNAVSEPTLLTKVSSVRFVKNSIAFVLTDQFEQSRAELCVNSVDEGIRFRVNITAPEPIWLVEWRLSNLNLNDVIIPALGGQALSKEMPPETILTYKYPFWWNAQFVIGAINGGGVWLGAQDPSPTLKMLRVGKSSKSFDLTFGVEATAPLQSKTLEAEWLLDCFQGDWKVPVDQHRQWMETAFDLKPLSEKSFCPAWIHDINFVLEIWGARKDSITPLHTFDQMIDRLYEFKELHNPAETLVYLPGFAEHGIDSHAPDYNPSKELGGEDRFRALVSAAHKLNYRVMVHTNVLAMTFTHPLYPQMKQHQVVDAFDRAQGWGLDIDGDWLAEPYFAYINPGAKQWGDLMEKVIGDLIRKFGVDAVFLDQTLLAFNVSRGPNFIQGMCNHIKRLQKAFPNILFAGEGMHEHVINPLPMAQIHGIDSITEIHGLEGQRPWRTAHQVLTYLFERYARFTAHLLTKHPSHPIFKLQESAYEELGVIPALCLYNSEQEMDLPAIKSMIERAKQLKW